MKKTLKTFGILILILFLFRGFFYRVLINYRDIGTRTSIKISNQKLIDKIDSKWAEEDINLEEIIQISNKITSEELSFSGNNVSNNPNELINTNRANCVGYSAMFNSIANYLIHKYNLQEELEAKHKIGALDFLGININQFFESSFFRDHDFNEIQNLQTKEIIAFDPSVYDYLWISEISK